MDLCWSFYKATWLFDGFMLVMCQLKDDMMTIAKCVNTALTQPNKMRRGDFFVVSHDKVIIQSHCCALPLSLTFVYSKSRH